MTIEGVNFERDEQCLFFKVNTLSVELKAEIQKQIVGMWSGFSEVEEVPTFYTLTNTLASFVDRYKDKTEEIKKGMIGELLAHTMLNHFMSEFNVLSVLKNKEERSIKKGFDIIYYHVDNKDIWYAEVKSGASENDDSTSYNQVLLNRAKDGIENMTNSRRISLWESAMIDAKLSIEEGARRINIRNLLSKGYEEATQGNDNFKNVVLISVLYHDLDDCIEFESMVSFKNEMDSEQVFNESFVISIQKSTYTAVGDFLKDLSRGINAS